MFLVHQRFIEDSPPPPPPPSIPAAAEPPPPAAASTPPRQNGTDSRPGSVPGSGSNTPAAYDSDSDSDVMSPAQSAAMRNAYAARFNRRNQQQQQLEDIIQEEEGSWCLARGCLMPDTCLHHQIPSCLFIFL